MENDIYILEKLLGNILILSKNAGKTFTESCNNPVRAFIESEFSYCPLICMFHSRTLNNKINRLHEKTLKIVYEDFNPNLGGLFKGSFWGGEGG